MSEEYVKISLERYANLCNAERDFKRLRDISTITPDKIENTLKEGLRVLYNFGERYLYKDPITNEEKSNKDTLENAKKILKDCIFDFEEFFKQAELDRQRKI